LVVNKDAYNHFITGFSARSTHVLRTQGADLTLPAIAEANCGTVDIPLPSLPTKNAGSEWFDQARFGLFVHWGLYSLLGHENGEWVLFKSNLDRQEYNHLAEQFEGKRFDARALAALAKRSGMRYMVLTTRHHDGYCLFDTKTTPFNSVQTSPGRDFVAEHVAACREAGLKVGLYCSVMSWQQQAIYTGPGADPAGWERMVQETHDQVRELMSNYGKIDMLWYDGAVVPGIQDGGMQAKFWRSDELNAMVRELQPDILINDRSGGAEDFSTPEQHVKPPEPGRRWEACMTINRSWGYNIHDRDFKSADDIIKNLIRCARYGGNLLLNIGPRADGSLQPECFERLAAVGRWLDRNGEAIYGTERCAYTEADHVAGPVTRNNGNLYVHLANFTGPSVLIDGVGHTADARILGCEKRLQTKASQGDAVLVSGLSEDMFASGPAVLVLRPSTSLDTPARLLGGGDEPRMEAGNAPVLGDDPDRHAPPIVPVASGDALLDYLDRNSLAPFEDSRTWCPGWAGWQVYRPDADNRLDLTLDVSVAGQYDLSIGLITRTAEPLQFFLDNQLLQACGEVANPGCPDTWDFPALLLGTGAHRLSVRGTGKIGMYALRLAPVWRPVPSECWYVIGPFPTAFGPQKPVREVRNALSTGFPPEEGFEPEASYAGAGDRPVSWIHSEQREGEHTDCGVNFPYRCGTHASGVCYARTLVVSPKPCRVTIMLGCDWWANLWVNGKLVTSNRDPEACEEDGAQFNTWKPRAAEVELKSGDNVFLVKCHPGTCANWFTFRINGPKELEIHPR
jgi:alpha-L-fucosidase